MAPQLWIWRFDRDLVCAYSTDERPLSLLTVDNGYLKDRMARLNNEAIDEDSSSRQSHLVFVGESSSAGDGESIRQRSRSWELVWRGLWSKVFGAWAQRGFTARYRKEKVCLNPFLDVSGCVASSVSKMKSWWNSRMTHQWISSPHMSVNDETITILGILSSVQ